MSKVKPNPRIWKAIEKAKKKGNKNPDAPKKESSGDGNFDKAIQEFLKHKDK